MVFNCSETRSQKNRQLSSRTCTRRPEDNGKKMVSKKKFIDYKNHFEGGGGGGGGGGSLHLHGYTPPSIMTSVARVVVSLKE